MVKSLCKIAEKLVFSVLYSDKATDMSPPPWGRDGVGVQPKDLLYKTT